jgi:diguanylate cyclase (GGDEF)-like protein
MRNNQPSAALYELLADLGACGRLDATLALLDSRLRRLLPLDAMVVFLPQLNGLQPVYVSPSAAGLGYFPGAGAAPAFAGAVAATRRPAFNRDPSQQANGTQYRSVLAIPLDDGSELAAVLALYSTERGAFLPGDLGVLLWIKADLARVIKHDLRRPPLDDRYDPLTGLLNERGLFARLDAELAKRDRAEMLALLLAGVDGLAEVQARFGEYALGRLLASVGAGLRRSCAAPAWAARFGDDFVVLEPAAGAGLVEARRASVPALIAGIGVAHFGQSLLSVRLGTACCPQDASDSEGLLAAAARQISTPLIPAALSEDLRRLNEALRVKVEVEQVA